MQAGHANGDLRLVVSMLCATPSAAFPRGHVSIFVWEVNL
jgi:hypothetical protein